MTTPGGSRDARGFTLIEVTVAVAILAIAVVLVWGSFWGAMRAKNDLEAIETRTREVRLGLGRMVRDLEHAYMSANQNPLNVEPLTFFIGDHHLGSDQVSFSYMGHRTLRAGARESETAIVTYFVESDRKDRSRLHLFRRESRRLGEENPSESGAAFVVCEDIVKLRLEYFDRQQDEWLDEWDTKNADGQLGRLPERVRITLTVRDERGVEVPFLTEARVFLQDALHFGS